MLIPPDFEPNFVQSKPVEQPLNKTLRRDVPVTMRDGTRLATDLYFPPQPGRCYSSERLTENISP
jgi:hypothetical protein